MAYATLKDTQNALKTDTTNATDDALLVMYLEQITERIESEFGRFAPWYEQQVYGINNMRIDSVIRTVRFDDPLLALSAVTVYGTSLTVGTDVEAYPPGVTPYRTLRLLSLSGSWYSTYADAAYAPLIKITGYWGIHRNYAQAWQKEDDVLNAGGITATATSITVADADGTNYQNRTPRFSAGNLIRVNSEYMLVTATNTTTQALTVQRGVRGTTAAAHALNDDIYVYYPMETVRHAVARQAALLLKRRGSYDAPAGMMGAIAEYPFDLLVELRGVLQGYVYT